MEDFTLLLSRAKALLGSRNTFYENHPNLEPVAEEVSEDKEYCRLWDELSEAVSKCESRLQVPQDRPTTKISD